MFFIKPKLIKKLQTHTRLKSVVFRSQLVGSVVGFFTGFIMTGVKHVQKSRADDKAVLNNVSIVVATSSRFSSCMSRKVRTRKLIEIITSIVIQKLIARCAGRCHRISGSPRTRESTRTIELDLLILVQRNYSVPSGRIEKFRCSRLDEERLWIGY